MNSIGKLKMSSLLMATFCGFLEMFVLMFRFVNAIKLGIAVGFAYQSPPPLYFKIAIS
jgi:hypothetical protein